VEKRIETQVKEQWGLGSDGHIKRRNPGSQVLRLQVCVSVGGGH